MFGVRVIGPGDFTGDIVNQSTATITVKGNNSAAISVETNLTGALNNGGAINITGNNSFGIHTTGSVGGSVTLGGSITASGQGIQAANLGGDIGGALLINGTITSTGYRYTTRSTDVNFLKELQADDLLQSGTAVTVAGNVAGGVLVDVAVTDPTTGDVTGLTGTITSIAAAPALVVGAVGRNITLGNVGTDVDAFGIEIKGSVLGSGVYDGVTSTAIQLGVAGGGLVDTTGGIHIAGSVGASAFAADATAIHLNSGVIAPVFRNDGSISGALSSDALGATARGILIEAGANVPVFQNSNSVTASVAGQLANAAALVDRSGTLVEVENIGVIGTSRTLTDVTQPVTGSNIAIDLSATTTGAHLLQDAPAGAVLVPTINGSVLFGSGNDRVEILAGTLTGDVDLGAGANSLTVDNGAVVKGALNAAGGTIALTVGTGTLQINSASQLSLTNLSLGGASSLILTADPTAGLATKLDVNGTATIASGATIGMRLSSIQQGTATYTLIRANQLNSGNDR